MLGVIPLVFFFFARLVVCIHKRFGVGWGALT